jgi:hypothetical protein
MQNLCGQITIKNNNVLQMEVKCNIAKQKNVVLFELINEVPKRKYGSSLY